MTRNGSNNEPKQSSQAHFFVGHSNEFPRNSLINYAFADRLLRKFSENTRTHIMTSPLGPETTEICKVENWCKSLNNEHKQFHKPTQPKWPSLIDSRKRKTTERQTNKCRAMPHILFRFFRQLYFGECVCLCASDAATNKLAAYCVACLCLAWHVKHEIVSCTLALAHAHTIAARVLGWRHSSDFFATNEISTISTATLG